MCERWNGFAVATLAVFAMCFWSADAAAQQTRTAEVPVQVGVGPAAYMLGGPTFDDGVGWGGGLLDDQPIHTGLRLRLTAIIESELVEEHPGMIPSQYRGYVSNAGEVRYAPPIVALLPSSLYLSPPIADSSVWGATWSLLALGMPFTQHPVRTSARAALIATAMYISSESVQSPYIFARPGVELQFDVEVPLDDRFLVSFGFSSQVHVPQLLDGPFTEIGGFDADSLWHIGQIYMQGHFRFPYSYTYSVQ